VDWEGGKQLDGLTAHVDMLPTLASLANVSFTPSKKLDGTNVSEYLLSKSEAPKRKLVTDTQRVPWPQKGKNSCVMEGFWRLINGKELYDVSSDPGQQLNVADKHPDRVNMMNEFYESWWHDVISETKFSVIEIGHDEVEVITCHDAHTVDYYPPWNQRMIRSGNPMKPASFSVDFLESGTYRFSLQRWPVESGMALGASIDDPIDATPYTNARVKGAAMNFKKAHLKIGSNEYSSDLDNRKEAAVIEAKVPAGETELLAYFDMEDGGQTNAFYLYVERI